MSLMTMIRIFFSTLAFASLERDDGQPNTDIITVLRELKAEIKEVKQHVQQQEVKDNATQQILKMLVHQNTEMKQSVDDLSKEMKYTRQRTEDIKRDADDAKIAW